MKRITRIALNMNDAFRLQVKYGALYYKWLSYKPPLYMDYINSLLCKNKLNEKEIDSLNSFREEEDVLIELEKYINNEDYNYDKVKNYISTHSIISIIYSRLSEEEIEKAMNNSEFDYMDHSYVIDQFHDEKILSFPGTMVDLFSSIIYAISEEEENVVDMILQISKGTDQMDKFISLYGHSKILKRWNTNVLND